MNSHISKIKEEFTKQSVGFNEYQKAFSKNDITNFAIEKMELEGNEIVLEVACGTCGFGRSVAQHVKLINELDITTAMLEVGYKEAIKQNITNQIFTIGEAENLPFLSSTFDIVMSRLAFHHFINPEVVFKEMKRVLKDNGKLVIVDMEARAENLREVADYYETLRDKSHTKCLSRLDFQRIADSNGMEMTFSETILVPVKLSDWMDLTKVNGDERIIIEEAMKKDILNEIKIGFDPYYIDDEIYFNHKWMISIFEKEICNE